MPAAAYDKMISRRRGQGDHGKQPCWSFTSTTSLVIYLTLHVVALIFLRCQLVWTSNSWSITNSMLGTTMVLAFKDDVVRLHDEKMAAANTSHSLLRPLLVAAGSNDSLVILKRTNDTILHEPPAPVLLLLEGGRQLSTNNKIRYPNVNRPFIFFHIPKCGGSTLRKVFNDAAKSIGKRMFAPCYDSVPCPITEDDIVGKKNNVDIEQKSACAEVLAGHFTTKLVTVMAHQTRQQQRDVTSSTNQCVRNWTSTTTTATTTTTAAIAENSQLIVPTFDCLVAVREPISRFVSHYYHFIEKDNPLYSGRRLKDMSMEDLTTIIHGSANNTMLNYLSSHLSGLVHPEEHPEYSFTLQEKIEAARDFLKQCVVLVMEDWQTSARLVESAVPWLKGHLSNATALNKRSSRVKNHESIEDFNPDVATALREILKGDIAVYDIAVNINQDQLRLFGIEATQSERSKTENKPTDESVIVTETQQRWGNSTFFNKIPFIKSVTYFGRGNPLNFWHQRFEDYIDSDFSRLREEGFNSLILLVPWVDVQLTVHPPTYKSFLLSRIEYVMQKAVDHGLFTIFRLSYPHGFDPMNNPASGHERCILIMGVDTSNGIQDESYFHKGTVQDFIPILIYILGGFFLPDCDW